MMGECGDVVIQFTVTRESERLRAMRERQLLSP